jgi:hypothetical protein
MTGTRTSRTAAHRRLSRALRAALTAVLLLAGIALSPGQATASMTYYPSGAVTPVLECVSRAGDGSWTAVLGYTNKAATKTVPRGSWNSISPTSYDGSQPTLFRAGTQHGALSLKISAHDYLMGGTAWMLDGNMVLIGAAYDAGVPTCTSVQLPVEGNDTGAGLALVVAGLLGWLVVARVRRRVVNAGEPGHARA